MEYIFQKDEAKQAYIDLVNNYFCIESNYFQPVLTLDFVPKNTELRLTIDVKH